MKTDKQTPETCRPYDDDHCTGCPYEGTFGCVVIRAEAAKEKAKCSG